MRPADLPSADKYPHGTRARYVGAKCRCDDCRAANTAYYHQRMTKARELAREAEADGNKCRCGRTIRKDLKGNLCGRCREMAVWNGLVPADRVRQHLRELSKKGVGYKSVAAAADVGKSTLLDIITGRKNVIRAQSERRVLAVDEQAAADAGRVDGKEVRDALAEMRRLGLTWSEIDNFIGCGRGNAHNLFTRERVEAKTVLRVKRALVKVREEYALYNAFYCPECMTLHDDPEICPFELRMATREDYPTAKSRRELLKKLIPEKERTRLTSEDVQRLRERLPGIYPGGPGGAGYRRLHHDLASLGHAPRKRHRP